MSELNLNTIGPRSGETVTIQGKLATSDVAGTLANLGAGAANGPVLAGPDGIVPVNKLPPFFDPDLDVVPKHFSRSEFYEFGGTNTARTYALLEEDLSELPFTVLVPWLYFDPIQEGSLRYIIRLMSNGEDSTSSSQRDGMFSLMYYSSSNTIDLRQYEAGSPYSDFRRAFIDESELLGYSGSVAIVASRDAAPKLYLRGLEVVAGEGEVGSEPPNWSDQINADYIVIGGRGPSYDTFVGAITPPIVICGALTAGEVLDWNNSGTLPLWAYNDADTDEQTSDGLTWGAKYRITTAGGDFASVGSGDNNVGTEFIAVGSPATLASPNWGTGGLVRLGRVWAPEKKLAYQTNDELGRYPMQSTTGVTRITSERRGRLTRTLAWDGTHEGVSLLNRGAIDQPMADGPIKITSIVAIPSASSSGDGITIGNTTDPDYYVTATPITADTPIDLDLAASIPASGDRVMMIDPDTANYTGTIKVIVDYVEL